MKTTIFAAALATALIGTSAMAYDLNDPTFTAVATSGNLQFTLDADENGLTEVETALSVLQTPQSYTTVSLGYLFDTDDITVGVAYNAATDLTQPTVLYGEFEVEYTTEQVDLSDGAVIATPMVGVSRVLTDSLSVYAEVDYTFVASNDFQRLGGTVEVGAPYAVSETVFVTPSLSRGFDGANDDTTANLEVAFVF